MYIPKTFLKTDHAELYQLIAKHNFGILVSRVTERPFATHLPFQLDFKDETAFLVSHMARANPQWQSLTDLENPVMAIFQPAHAYISPTWYVQQSPIPTWNYMAVHVYGSVEVIHDEMALLSMVRNLTRYHESGHDNLQTLSDAALTSRLKAIVGIKITITELQGKYKLSQNRSTDDQQAVITALEPEPNAHLIREQMQTHLDQQ